MHFLIVFVKRKILGVSGKDRETRGFYLSNAKAESTIIMGPLTVTQVLCMKLIEFRAVCTIRFYTRHIY